MLLVNSGTHILFDQGIEPRNLGLGIPTSAHALFILANEIAR